MALLASVSNSLKVWNFEEPNLNLIAECNFVDKDITLNFVTWNHNQQVVAVAGTSSSIYLVQASTGQILSSLPFKDEDRFVGDVVSLSFSHNSRYLASTNNSNAVIWDLKRRSIRTILEGHRHNLNSLLFTPDGILLTGDVDGNLRAWNVDRSTSTADLTYKSLHTPINAIQLSPSSRQLSTGYNDGSLTLWSMESISPYNHISALHEGPITSLSYSPKNEKLIASAGQDGNIHLVDVSINSPSPAMSIRTAESINTISFHESSLYISAGTANGTIYLYDWRNAKKPLHEIPSYHHHPIKCVMFQKLMTRSASTLLNQSTSSIASGNSINNIQTATSEAQENRDEVKKDVERYARKENNNDTIPTSSLSVTLSEIESKEGMRNLDLSRFSNNHEYLSDTIRTSHMTTGREASFRSQHIQEEEEERREDRREEEEEKEHGEQQDRVQNHSFNSEGGGEIRQKSRPVTALELTDALQLLKYDIHQDLRGIIREQVRQFALAKKDMEEMIEKLSSKLDEVMVENRELRAENERLRHIY